jgi:hypothetical protein
MFSRESCHFFVRPKKSLLELCVFLEQTEGDDEAESRERQARANPCEKRSFRSKISLGPLVNRFSISSHANLSTTTGRFCVLLRL